MGEDRPPLDAFDDAVIDAAAGDAVPPDELRDLVESHQERVRALPGVEDIVYEWRSQFHEDPLVHRAPSVYVLVHRPHVWSEFATAMALSEAELDALRTSHDRQARRSLDGPVLDDLDAGEPMVLTRP